MALVFVEKNGVCFVEKMAFVFVLKKMAFVFVEKMAFVFVLKKVAFAFVEKMAFVFVEKNGVLFISWPFSAIVAK